MEKLSGLNGLNSLNSIGGGSTLPPTSAELLLMAQMQGGAVGEVADELTQHNRSILSTVAQPFKNAFKGFIDLISLPSQMVAGAISQDLTIEEAIRQKTRVSDVIFGSNGIDFNGDGNETTMEKVGNFLVRLPVDILTDPTTYLTFGASSARGFLGGAMGLKSLPKVSLQKGAAEFIGKNIDQGDVISKSLSDTGSDVLTYLKKYEAQVSGKIAADKVIEFGKNIGLQKRALIESGIEKSTIDFTENELKHLIKNTVESPLNIDFAKKTMSNLLEHSPQLTGTLIDNGGIKFFGKSLLSAQRIGSVVDIIPGMTLLDNVTAPFRNSVQAMFDPSLIKVDDNWVRLPEELVNFETKMKDLAASRNSDFMSTIQRIQKITPLNQNEMDIVSDAIHSSKRPSDVKLQKVYDEMIGILDKDVEMFKQMGVPKSKLDQYTGLVFVGNDTKKVKYNSVFSRVPGTAQFASYAKAIQQSQIPVLSTDKSFASRVEAILPKNIASEIGQLKSPQEIGFAIGKQLDEYVKTLRDKGMSLDNINLDEKYLELSKLRGEADTLGKNPELIGRLENLGLKETDDYNFFADNEGRIYKRVATTAQELKGAGIDGFDTNILTAFTTRQMKNNSQLFGQSFMEGLVRNYGKFADEAPTGWVSIKSSALDDKAKLLAEGLINEQGQEMLFHPAIAKRFDELMKGMNNGDEITSDVLKAYDKILRYWKSSVTSIFPQFHGRNAISNVFQNFLDLGIEVLNPKTHGMAIDIMAKSRKLNSLMDTAMGTGDDAVKATQDIAELMNTKMFTDRVGNEWTFGELRSVAKDNNIAFMKGTGYIDTYDREKMLTDFLGMNKTKISKTKDIAQKVLPVGSPDKFLPTKVGQFVGSGIEDQARLVNFMTNLKNTGDVSHAAIRTKQFLFDYSNLTKFEKNVLRRLIPFYTFTRKNLELQAKTLLSSPGRISAEIKAVKGFGEILGGEELTDEEQKLLPPWLKNSINLKRKGKDGRTQLITGFGLPIEQPFQAFTKSQLLGSVSPVIRFPIEASTGYDWFRGKPTSEVIQADNYKDFPQAVKDYIGFTHYEGTTKDGKKYDAYVSLKPENMHLLNNLPFSRIASVMGNITDKSTAEGLKTLQLATGVRTYTFEEEQIKAQQERALQTKLEKILKDSGIRGEFTRGYNRKNTKTIE